MQPLWQRTWYVKQRGRRWCVIRGDATVAASLHESKDDAVARALEIAERVGGRVRVKAPNGRLEHEVDLETQIQLRS